MYVYDNGYYKFAITFLFNFQGTFRPNEWGLRHQRKQNSWRCTRRQM